MEKETNIATVNQTYHPWLISLAVVCLGIIAYGYLYSKNQTSDFAFLFGYNLPIGLAIWGIFHVAIGRKQGSKKAVISFLVIFGALIASGLIGYSQQKSAAIQAITEIQKDYASVTKPATDAQGLPQRIEGQLDTTPKTKGEFGEMERFMKTVMNKMASQRNDYLLELDAIGWDKILDSERVKQDKTLIESKMMLQKANDIVSKYRAQTYVLLENARKDIGNLNVSENLRSEMASGFDTGMAKSRSQIDTLWGLEAKTISEFENIFALLAARKGTWVVQNGQILFASDSDLSAFNSYVTAIQELATKQEAIQKQNVEAVNTKLNGLKNELNKPNK